MTGAKKYYSNSSSNKEICQVVFKAKIKIFYWKMSQ